MGLLRKISPTSVLRLSLGFSYLYSGFDLAMHPTGWYWAIRPLPEFIQTVINSVGTDNFLRTQGVVELAIAFALLAWFLPKGFVRLASLLVTLQMISILIFVGLSLDTFRDVVILGAGFSLFLTTLDPLIQLRIKK